MLELMPQSGSYAHCGNRRFLALPGSRVVIMHERPDLRLGGMSSGSLCFDPIDVISRAREHMHRLGGPTTISRANFKLEGYPTDEVTEFEK